LTNIEVIITDQSNNSTIVNSLNNCASLVCLLTDLTDSTPFAASFNQLSSS